MKQPMIWVVKCTQHKCHCGVFFFNELFLIAQSFTFRFPFVFLSSYLLHSSKYNSFSCFEFSTFCPIESKCLILSKIIMQITAEIKSSLPVNYTSYFRTYGTKVQKWWFWNNFETKKVLKLEHFFLELEQLLLRHYWNLTRSSWSRAPIDSFDGTEMVFMFALDYEWTKLIEQCYYRRDTVSLIRMAVFWFDA